MGQPPLFPDDPSIGPLAERMRPRTLDDVVGQQALVGEGGVIRSLLIGRRAAVAGLLGPTGERKDHHRPIACRCRRRRDGDFFGGPLGRQGGPCGDVRPRAACAVRRTVGRCSLSTRSIVSTAPSRTPFCPLSRPATSCSSVPPPRTPPSSSTARCCRGSRSTSSIR